MKIEKNKVVSFHYALSSVDGEKLESSHKSDPTVYLHGHGGLMYSLETAMEGHVAGDEFSVTIPPERAYGVRKEGAEQRVPIKHLLNAPKKLRKGMAIKINTKEGVKDARIIKVGKFNVDVDINHPLAGLELTFDINVVDVREAKAEEISHGHVHGPGGHHH